MKPSPIELATEQAGLKLLCLVYYVCIIPNYNDT